MKKHAHWWLLLLFVAAFLYDAIIWGGAARLPDIGAKLQRAAQREALLANVYMACGAPILNVLPPLDAWAQNRFQAAVYEGFPRIHDDPAVAFDVIFSNDWNSQQRMLRIMYWATPVLALATIFFWLRRPKEVSLMGRR